MYPILFEIGPFSLHTYGLAMAIAFGLGIWVAMKRAEKIGLGSKFVLDLSLLILIFSLVGARGTYVVTHRSEFSSYPLDIISPVQHDGRIGIAGLVLLGGVLAAFVTIYVYSRLKQKPLFIVADTLVPPTALGIAIGRLGCFFNGCCFGLPTHVPWCLHFPSESLAGSIFPNACLHPTQLYESIWMLLVFVGMSGYDYRHVRPQGRATGFFLLLYGMGRFFIEQIRWYEQEMILWQSDAFRFTFSQLISVLLFVGGCVLIWKSHKRKATT